ncbi:hypothetical protein [Actinospongicola halichondriae]|uniref:hypothetical protein n=1 Tax=Actinospongicola halichondriae TaxID=3236844 RepID=UPI003D435774
MRRTGTWLLVGGGVLCALTLSVAAMTAGSSSEFEVINTTPYLIWAGVGAVLLILGGVFFAASEVIRVLDPTEPAPEMADAGRSHWS